MLLIVIEHIVWDWNGTLFDDALIVYLASCQVFAARGLPSVTAAEYRAAYTRPIQDFYHRLFGRQLEDGEFVGLDDAFHDAYRGTMAGVTLATGSRQALRDWRLGGRTQSLLSMFRHEQLVTLVGRYGIQDEFVRIDGLVGPGGGPKVEHLIRHLAALRLDPAVVLLVDGREEDAVKPGLEVAIKEPAALLLLAVELWEEEVERDVFEADKAAERVVRDLVNRL